MSEKMLRVPLDAEVRSLDRERRIARFVASTERAVPTRNGPEVLRMYGCRLARFRKNGVVLDSHNQNSINAIIGKAEVRIDKEKRELEVAIEYAPTAAGEQAWRLVEGGFVRAVSIGYSVNPRKVTRLREGEADGEGEARIEGPATIVREWELLEVSNVPVPADEDAVRRSFYESLPEGDDEELDMSQPTTGSKLNFTAALTPKPEGERAATAETVTPAPVATPAAQPAPVAAPTPEAPKPEADSVRKAAELEEARSRAILARAPQGSSLHALALDLVARGVSVEEAHKALAEEQARRFKPLGTPDAPPPPKPETTTSKAETKPLTGEDYARAFRI